MRETVIRRLQLLAGAVVVLGILHHADHVFRGNHSGWPFTQHVTPFTFSLLVYPLLIIGLIQLARGRLIPMYWIIVSLAIAALLAFVHFIPGPKFENPWTDIFLVYADPNGPASRYSLAPSPEHLAWLREVYGPHASALWGCIALTILALLTAAAWALVWVAIQSRTVTRAGALHG